MNSLASATREIQEVVNSPQKRVAVTFGTAAGLTTAVAAGYTLWAAQGGTLLASAFASLPVWRLMDPLPVLENPTKASRQSGQRSKPASETERRIDRILGEGGPVDDR